MKQRLEMNMIPSRALEKFIPAFSGISNMFQASCKELEPQPRMSVIRAIRKAIFATDESDLAEACFHILRDLLHKSQYSVQQPAKNAPVTADIIVESKTPTERYLFLMKSKLNCGSGDALTQVMDYYKKACSLATEKGKGQKDSLYPCFLLVVHPMEVTLYGAINVMDMVVVSVLQRFHFHMEIPEVWAMWRTICQVIDRLTEYIDLRLEQVSMQVPLLNKEQETTGKLTQLCQLASRALVFRAKLDGKQEVVAKFCHSYGEDVHKHMELNESAPRLYACEEIKSWRLVVMEYKDLPTLEKFLEKERLTGDQRDGISAELTNILSQLQTKQFVHGDLRLPNILIQMDEDKGTFKLFVIDFDWSGEQEKVRYPLCVNREKFEVTVEGGGVIAAFDDEQQVEYLKTTVEDAVN